MGRSPGCEKAHTNKGAWTKEEDDRLKAYINSNGEGCWRSLPKSAGLLRCGKSCRLRWINYLRPHLKRGNFTQHEDQLIIKLHSLLGNKWSLIAGKLPGRTDNEIKNYWNTHFKRKIQNRGIDPVTHRPLTEVASNSDSSTRTATTSFPTPITSVKKEEIFKLNDEKLSLHQQIQEPEIEKYPDLNLDLRISPPYQENTEGLKTSANICFTCSLGLDRTQNCNCTKNIVGLNVGKSNGVGICYDFLGLRNNGVVEFRSLEMK